MYHGILVQVTRAQRTVFRRVPLSCFGYPRPISARYTHYEVLLPFSHDWVHAVLLAFGWSAQCDMVRTDSRRNQPIVPSYQTSLYLWTLVFSRYTTRYAHRPDRLSANTYLLGFSRSTVARVARRQLQIESSSLTDYLILFEVGVPANIPTRFLLICRLDEREDGKDTLGADSAMSYLQSIGVGLEDASLFLAVELLQAPSIGEIPRAGFVSGWKDAG